MEAAVYGWYNNCIKYLKEETGERSAQHYGPVLYEGTIK